MFTTGRLEYAKSSATILGNRLRGQLCILGRHAYNSPNGPLNLSCNQQLIHPPGGVDLCSKQCPCRCRVLVVQSFKRA